MRDKFIKLITSFLLLLFLISIFSFSPTATSKNEIFQTNLKEDTLKSSKFWDLTGSPIFIDDSDPSKNWSYTASHYDWCSGSGNWTDPYTIENVTIDGQGSGNCIEIRNSDAYFIIQNCLLFNAGSSSNNAGIYLYYIDNGKMINNDCSDNNYNGMHLDHSDNNTLSGNTANNNNKPGIDLQYSNNTMLSENTVSNNSFDGVFLNYCNNNTLSGNNVSNNYYDGISLGYSDGNTLSGNNANYNNQAGIYIASCNNNTISGNNASNNKYEGIFLTESNNNTLSGNTATNNIYGGISLGGSYNTLSGNIASNNSYGGISLGGSYNTLSGNNASNNNDHGISLGGSYNTLSGNIASNNNDHGIYLSNSANNTLSGNNASNNNNRGIYLRYSNNNTLSGTTSSNNSFEGLYLYESNNNTLSGNNIRNNNNYGIILDESNNNLIYNNTFINNGVNAKDDGIDNHWDNGIVGNYWDDYGGKDTNDDCIGDTPYLISGTAGSQDNFPIWTDGDDITPVVTIIFPLLDSVFGLDAPNYNISIDELNLDTIWYTLDGGINNFTITSLTGTFNQLAWGALSEGDVTIRFYASDTGGNIGSAAVTIKKDISAPDITIIFPLPDSVFGLVAPNYNISIDELNLDTIWYTLDGGITNYTITGLTGTFYQTVWEALPEGNVIIRFYANDTLGRIGFAEVTIKKDVTAPIITIINPQNNDLIGATAPNFSISIDEPNLYTVWYSLNGGTNTTFTGLTGTVNQTLWDALPEGNVTIRFYANDSVGNVNFQEITVKKTIPQPIPPGIPGYDLLFLLGIISVMVVIIIKKRINHLN